MMQTRNWRFDCLKAISCLSVVFLHVRFPGLVGDLIIYAFRFPVPLFFMISGYYGYGRSDSWMMKKAVQTLKILIFSELAYAVWVLLTGRMGETWELFCSHPIQILLYGCLFNRTLWYLNAALWSYLALVLLRKCSIYRWANIPIAVLLTLQVVGRYYIQNHCDIEEYIYYFCSAALMGLPLMLVGAKLAEHEAQIQRRFNAWKSFGVIVLGGVVMVAEYVLSGQYMDFHYSTLVISVGMFLFAMTHQGAQNPVFGLLAYIGQKLSLWIYLLHIWVSSVLNLISKSIGFEENTLWLWALPIVTVLITCCLAQAVALVKNRKTIGAG